MKFIEKIVIAFLLLVNNSNCFSQLTQAWLKFNPHLSVTEMKEDIATGDIVVLSGADPTYPGGAQYFNVTKYTQSGNLVWDYTYANLACQAANGTSAHMTLDASGNIFVVSSVSCPSNIGLNNYHT